MRVNENINCTVDTCRFNEAYGCTLESISISQETYGTLSVALCDNYEERR
ncbi:MAG: DUF1540 domain-containing protein [Planctomycetota bacterium]|jgi:hypothetical protein